MRLRDKVSVITGAASGIARATALKFAKEGAVVVVCDCNIERVNEVVAEIETNGGKANGYLVDVTKPTQIQAMVAAVHGQYGRIDVLVNNAGIVMDTQLSKMTEDQFDRVIDVNLKGAYNCVKAVVDSCRHKAAASSSTPRRSSASMATLGKQTMPHQSLA